MILKDEGNRINIVMSTIIIDYILGKISRSLNNLRLIKQRNPIE